MKWTAAAVKDAILAARGPFLDFCDKRIDLDPSPDGKRALAFSHGWEATMMNNLWKLTLLEGEGKVAHGFDDDAISTRAAWSADSKLFAVAVEGERLLVCDAEKRRSAFIRLASRTNIAKFEGDAISLSYDPDQLRALNSQHTFGAGKAEWPIARYKAPQPVTTALKALSWGPLAKDAPEDALEVKLEPVRDGWFPFAGKYPDSTAVAINGQPMLVDHLEAFAEHGDAQSREWLDAVKQAAKKRGKPVSALDQVHKIIGRRKRAQ